MDQHKKDLLVFGYGLGVIAFIFGIGGFLKHGMQLAPGVLFMCGTIFFAVSVLNWPALKPGYIGWMKVAHLIGTVVTTLVLSLVFIVLFAPMGILFRIMGKDHLDRKIDFKARTYWRKRPKAVFSREQCHQQY